MHRRIAVLFALLVLGAGAAACSKDDNSGKPASDTTTSTTTSAAPVDNTTSTTASTSTPSGPAASPQAAADGLFNAWKNNNQAGASNYAKPQAISKIFSRPYTTGSVTYTKQACQPQGGQFECAWSYEGGAVKMTIEAWPGGGFVVDSVTYVAE